MVIITLVLAYRSKAKPFAILQQLLMDKKRLGQRYRVSWDEANFGYVDTAAPSASYDDDNFFSFMLNNTKQDADILSVAQTWSPNSFEFVSDRTGSYDLTIRLGSTNQSYLSMDGLTIKAVSNVPEPKTWLMLLGGLLLVMPRRD